MIKLCFMASHGYSIPGLGLPQELTNTEIIKNSRFNLLNTGTRQQEIIPASSSFNLLNPEHLEQSWKPVSSFNESNHFVEMDSTMMKPMLMDIHETAVPESSLVLSFGKYERQEKVMEFLRSRTKEFKERGFDMSLLSEMMELEAMKSSSGSQLLPYGASSVLYLNQESAKKPVLDLVKEMMDNPEFFSAQLNGQLNDIFSIASEFDMSRNSTKWRQLSPLIPHFERFESEVFTPAKLKAVPVLAPLKSPEKTKLKPPKKHNNTKRKAKEERDLYKRNHLHAYESLLSLLIGNDHHHQHTTVLSLQKSSGELSELLTKFSIGVAGTGIAVLFSVACSVASRSVPFCADKFFDTGLGLSLVILSWAVNRLREVIVHVNKKTANNNKVSSSSKKDGEIMNTVERSVKEVYYRAATVIAVFALRFAC